MKKIVYLSVAVIGLFIACKKEDTKPAIQSQTFEINATSKTSWRYFSFAQNDTIAVTDSASSNEWDLAFQRNNIKTNGGKSGNGMGSAANSYQKGQTGFDALKLVPDTSTFISDDSVVVPIQGSYTIYVINPVLFTWFTMQTADQGTQIVPTDNIYIVKTGTGKFAKVWFKSYYNAYATSGYVTIQYKYQPDGSKNLE